MTRVISIFLGVAVIAFSGYLFLSDNIALAIVILMGSIIFLPLLIMAIKNQLYFGNTSHDTSNATSGGTSGGVGSSGGCGGDGC